MSIIIAGASGQPAEVETGHRASRAVIRPNDVGALGAYSLAAVSGLMAAGLTAASPIFSLRYGGAGLALIRRVLISAQTRETAFSAGQVHLDLFVARSFSASDTGGTSVLPTVNKMKTTMATTGMLDARASATAALSAGTRTLDGQPIGMVSAAAIATNLDYVLVPAQTPAFERRVGEWPLVLAVNEGIVLQATVPATGTWSFQVQVDWEEVSAFGSALAA